MSEVKIRNYKDLIIWQDAVDLVEDIYRLTGSFPKDEQYGLVAQARRSTVSVPSNIAEGFMRHHKKEFKQYLFISLASLAEVETQMIIAARLKYISKSVFDSLTQKFNKLNKMVMALIKKL